MARIFRKVLLPGESAPFVMELPPYRLPTLKGLLIHMWDRGSMYVQKAGTIILAGSVLIWFLSSYPAHPKFSVDYTRLLKAENIQHQTALANIASPMNLTFDTLKDFTPFKNYQKVQESFKKESTTLLQKQCDLTQSLKARNLGWQQIEEQYPGTLSLYKKYERENLRHQEAVEDLASRQSAEKASLS